MAGLYSHARVFLTCRRNVLWRSYAVTVLCEKNHSLVKLRQDTKLQTMIVFYLLHIHPVTSISDCEIHLQEISDLHLLNDALFCQLGSCVIWTNFPIEIFPHNSLTVCYESCFCATGESYGTEIRDILRWQKTFLELNNISLNTPAFEVNAA